MELCDNFAVTDRLPDVTFVTQKKAVIATFDHFNHFVHDFWVNSRQMKVSKIVSATQASADEKLTINYFFSLIDNLIVLLNALEIFPRKAISGKKFWIFSRSTIEEVAFADNEFGCEVWTIAFSSWKWKRRRLIITF